MNAQTRDDVKREIDVLRAQIDSLKNARNEEVDETLEVLSERLDKQLSHIEGKVDALSRSMAPIAFNPRMTAFLNMAARVDSRKQLSADGSTEIQNRPFLRTIELDFRAAVDPYADAVVILAVEDEAGTGFAVEPEEAYGVIKRLPVFETAPLGLKMKVGKFRAPFGQNNRYHLHDLPWVARPLPIAGYLGTEHGEFFECGYNPVGVDFDFFLPAIVPGTTWEMNVDVLRAGEIGLSGGTAGDQPALLGHLNVSTDWANEHLVVIGASAFSEQGENSTSLVGVDLMYKWTPSENRQSHSWVLGGEAFFGRKERPDSTGFLVISKPFGGFAFVQGQFTQALYAGLRADYLREPVDTRMTTKSLSAYVSYYTTEFLRIRAGIERKSSNIAAQNDVTTGLLEFNFVFGSHPTEPYWVNR